MSGLAIDPDEAERLTELTAEAVKAVRRLDEFTLWRIRRAAINAERKRQVKAEAACREIECPYDGDCGGCPS